MRHTCAVCAEMPDVMLPVEMCFMEAYAIKRMGVQPA